MMPRHGAVVSLLIVLVKYVCVAEGASRLLRTSFAGPYQIKMRQVSGCFANTDTETMLGYISCKNNDGGTSNADRHKKLDVVCNHLVGNLTLRRDLSNTALPGTLTLNQWRDKEWKKDGFVMKFPNIPKSGHDMMPQLYRAVLGNTDPNDIKKGVYYVDTPLKLEFKAVPVFPYGRWKGLLEMFNPPLAKSIACMNLLVDVVPK